MRQNVSKGGKGIIIEHIIPFPHFNKFAADNFDNIIFVEIVENPCRCMRVQLLNGVENLVAKGKTAGFEQFSCCHIVFNICML